MKSNLLISLVVLTSFTSCTDFGVPYNQTAAYRGEQENRRIQAVRREYWERQNQPMATPVLEKSYTPVTIPEHTLPDGTVIGEHIEYVETVH